MITGSIVALITPMHEDGSIDKKSLQTLIEWHIANKTDAIVALGTTGESATIEPDEHYDILSFVVKQVAKRIPVIGGAGTNNTKTTLKLVANAQRAGVDACLIVTPYYNKPPQNGLYLHYKTIAEQTHFPLILYNVPGRTGCDLLPETIERLAKVPHIIGVKEATGKLDRVQDIIRRCDKSFTVYSGDDATAMDAILQGAKGVISVTANIAPEKMHAMCQAALSGNKLVAEKLNAELALLHKNLFLEANPIPSKWALHTLGKIASGIRMPLLPLDSKYHPDVKKAMQQAGVL